MGGENSQIFPLFFAIFLTWKVRFSTYSKDFDEEISKLSKSQHFYNRFQQVAKNTEWFLIFF